MRMRTQRILAALLSLVLLLALAPAGWAVNGGGTGGDTGRGGNETPSLSAAGLDLDTPNKVVVNLVPSDKEGTTFATDIVNAKIEADLYLVAKAVKDTGYDSYHYEYYGSAFSTLEDAVSKAVVADPNNQNDYGTMMKKFSPIAQEAAKIVLNNTVNTENTPVATAASEITVDNLDAGLYLLILRGSDLNKDESDTGYFTKMTKVGGGTYKEYADAEDPTKDVEITATRAISSDYEYLFEPQLISLPAKSEGNYNTAYGTWTNILNITAKPDWKPRNGELRITKTLTKYVDQSKENYSEPAIFVFDIIGRKTSDENGEIIYRRQIAMNFTSQDQVGKTETLTDIPVGTYVWVEETYQGAHYTGGPTTTFPIQVKPKTNTAASTAETGEAAGSGSTVTAEDVAEAKFSDTDNNTHRGGHGIENVFTFNGTNWTNGWTTDPVEAKDGGAV